ncbi:MAG: YggT family protein [Burkholderiales bacterium]
MLAQALEFLVRTLFDFLTAAFLLRFLLQVVRAPARNPLSTFLIAVTDFAVRPARRVVPGWRGYDLSTLVLAWLAATLTWVAVLMLRGAPLGSPPLETAGGLALLGLVGLLKLTLYIVLFAVLIQAVLSWINPHSPAAPLLAALTRPFLAPLRRRVPAVGGVDISPVLVIVACQLLITVFVPPLENAAAALLRV